MSAWLSQFTQPWSTTQLPSHTTLTHVAPQAYSGLVSTLMSISEALPTETNRMSLYEMAKKGKAAQASLSVLSAQRFMATATDNERMPEMTSVIWNSTMELQELEKGINLYQMELSPIANGIFAGLFALLLVAHIVLFLWKRHPYFGVCLSMGTACEFTGYIGRIASIGNYGNKDAYLCQIICLTLAPALLMAGVYFVLAQLTVIHGRQYSVLKPLWFSYIFVFCDFVSLVVQAAGGASAAVQLQRFGDTQPGTNTMVAGIAFQVVSMTLFLYFLFDFMNRKWFKASPHVKFTFHNLLSFLFATSRGRELTQRYLNPKYNPKYEHIWSRKSFAYFPIVLLLSVFFIYVRCVYRLVELTEGWSGYLITHEEFVMTLDGLMVLLMVMLLVPFHPGVLMGKGSNISLKSIRNVTDQEDIEAHEDKSFSGSTWSDDSTKKSTRSEKVHTRELSVSSQESDNSDIFSPGKSERKSFLPILKDSARGSSKQNKPDFVAVPYSQTAESTVQSTPVKQPQSNRSGSKKFTLRNTQSRTSSKMSSRIQSHVNPYETPRESQFVANSGPYREEPVYSPQHDSLENPFEQHVVYDERDHYEYDDGSNHFDDVQSQVTHDEDFFNFGH
ncbi:hypothetical protein CJJ07_001085 [Candidozyma auris]|nr:hypothetical protein CJJ07_001085 [[Candida] auris]QEL58665.1 hypothetical protein CJJ09_000713 [[Candida] auris]